MKKPPKAQDQPTTSANSTGLLAGRFYARHAAAIAELIAFTHDHWISFIDLIPEENRDAATEQRVTNYLNILLTDVDRYAAELSRRTDLDDATYEKETVHASGRAGHMRVDTLRAIHALRAKAVS